MARPTARPPADDGKRGAVRTLCEGTGLSGRGTDIVAPSHSLSVRFCCTTATAARHRYVILLAAILSTLDEPNV